VTGFLPLHRAGEPRQLPVLENFVYGDTPDRDAIAHLLDIVRQSGAEWEFSLLRLSNETNIRQLPLKTLLVYLEMAGSLHRPTATLPSTVSSSYWKNRRSSLVSIPNAASSWSRSLPAPPGAHLVHHGLRGAVAGISGGRQRRDGAGLPAAAGLDRA
jgi:hypothetical protein